MIGNETLTPGPAAERRSRRSGLLPYLPVLVFLCLTIAPLVLGWKALRLEDDAYYYLIVARNILEHGESSAALGIPTNGYHPLWLGTLVLFGWLFGFPPLGIQVFEILLVGLGLAALIRFGGIRSPGEAALYVFGLGLMAMNFATVGMETSLLFPVAVGLMLVALRPDTAHRGRQAIALFLLCGLVIGARLDAAFFVLPILLLAAVPRRTKLQVLLGLALAGAIYAIVNQILFDTPLPVSGAIKSMSPGAVNAAYLAQIRSEIAGLATAPYGLPAFSLPWFLAALTAVVLVLRWIVPSLAGVVPAPVARLMAAVLIGFALFSAKLIFGSSWRVWHWYGYPALFFAVPLIFVAHEACRAVPPLRYAAGAAGLAAVTVFTIWAATPRPEGGFRLVNEEAARQYERTLAGQRVAMGDRAGSLAWAADMELFHLEGLVNSAAFAARLEQPGDLRDLLCTEGVVAVADYAPPLGAYETHRAEALQPGLSGIASPPYVTVRADEEIGRVADWSVFGGPGTAITDDTLYLWRLDCP